MKEMKERISTIEARLNIHANEIKELRKENEEQKRILANLQENIGMINVYKAILKNTDEIHRNSKESNKSILIIIGILSVLILILVIVSCINQRDFNKYREESIPKGEIVEILKDLQNGNNTDTTEELQ